MKNAVPKDKKQAGKEKEERKENVRKDDDEVRTGIHSTREGLPLPTAQGLLLPSTLEQNLCCLE